MWAIRFLAALVSLLGEAVCIRIRLCASPLHKHTEGLHIIDVGLQASQSPRAYPQASFMGPRARRSASGLVTWTRQK
jgi:hypothetical protein